MLKVEAALNFILQKQEDHTSSFNFTSKIKKHDEEVLQVENDYNSTLDFTFDLEFIKIFEISIFAPFLSVETPRPTNIP